MGLKMVSKRDAENDQGRQLVSNRIVILIPDQKPNRMKTIGEMFAAGCK
jgi:hypothetical protein